MVGPDPVLSRLGESARSAPKTRTSSVPIDASVNRVEPRAENPTMFQERCGERIEVGVDGDRGQFVVIEPAAGVQAIVKFEPKGFDEVEAPLRCSPPAG